MTPPDDTPPKWLQPSGPGHLPSADLNVLLCRSNVLQTLPEWLAWRSRVAEALGLVEREQVEAELLVAAEAFAADAAERASNPALSGSPQGSGVAAGIAACADGLRRRVVQLREGDPVWPSAAAGMREIAECDDDKQQSAYSKQLRARADELDGGK